MRLYESRIIGPTGAATLISHGDHLNDASAIGAAKALCREGELAEVWRGEVCIYNKRPTGGLVWPLQNKKRSANGAALAQHPAHHVR
jgi:hypothetical protein